MIDSGALYLEICSLAKTPQAYFFLKNAKDFYLQMVTTIFFELMTAKNSPLISKFRASNGINFFGNFLKLTDYLKMADNQLEKFSSAPKKNFSTKNFRRRRKNFSAEFKKYF